MNLLEILALVALSVGLHVVDVLALLQVASMDSKLPALLDVLFSCHGVVLVKRRSGSPATGALVETG